MALAVGGCTSKEEQARRDAADIAAVKAAQNQLPPLVPANPEPLSPADLARLDAPGGVCSFVASTSARAEILLASDAHFAWIRLDGGLVKLASDPGSAPGPAGSWTHYVGKEQTLRIEGRGNAGVPPSATAGAWPSRITLRDPHDRVVFSSDGTLGCRQ
ncbi:MAG: hypothetical protein U1E37_11530 [Sphingomonadaceae bacterium]